MSNNKTMIVVNGINIEVECKMTPSYFLFGFRRLFRFLHFFYPFFQTFMPFLIFFHILSEYHARNKDEKSEHAKGKECGKVKSPAG